MTAATLSNSASRHALAGPPQRKAKVGFGDLLAHSVRQHRASLIAITAFYVLYGLLIQLSGGHGGIGFWTFDPKVFVPALAGVVALFWGAPLLGAEYEQHTNLFVWSQDASPLRWLIAKLTLFGSVVVVFSVALTLIVQNQIAEAGEQYPGSSLAPYGFIGFEAWIPLAIAYALFGFLLGVAVGAVSRRVVASIGITLVAFAGVRVLVAAVLRPFLFDVISPVERIVPVGTWMTQPDAVGSNIYDINNELFMNASGQQTPVPENCWGMPDLAAQTNCVTSTGITKVGDIYQPYSKLIVFHSIELGVYVVLIAVCAWVAIWAVRRRASA
jgi:hypothetical protein